MLDQYTTVDILCAMMETCPNRRYYSEEQRKQLMRSECHQLDDEGRVDCYTCRLGDFDESLWETCCRESAGRKLKNRG